VTTKPVTLDLGTVSLPSGHEVRCLAKINVQIELRGVPPGSQGLIIEDHLRALLVRLIEKLGGPMAWAAAMLPDDADGDDEGPS
jgi:hypothetical protein